MQTRTKVKSKSKSKSQQSPSVEAKKSFRPALISILTMLLVVFQMNPKRLRIKTTQ